MGATGLYYLNELDMFTTYGFAPAKGTSDSILSMRKRKEVYFNDWPEINGKEYDLSEAPKYEDRVITLKGHIIATSESDFHAKYNALKSAFNVTGTLVLRCNELGSDYNVNVFFLDSTQPNRMTRLKNSSLIAVEIELKLQEVQNVNP